jgi:hypothetical protein
MPWQVAAYEQLLRRLIRRAPDAALLAVGTFNFQRFQISPAAQGVAPTAVDVPNPLYGSGVFCLQGPADRQVCAGKGIQTDTCMLRLMDVVCIVCTQMLLSAQRPGGAVRKLPLHVMHC